MRRRSTRVRINDTVPLDGNKLGVIVDKSHAHKLDRYSQHVLRDDLRNEWVIVRTDDAPTDLTIIPKNRITIIHETL